MKTRPSVFRLAILVGAILAGFALNLRAQPVITDQPASQTNLAGATVSFSVAVGGHGPFTYRWQFDGTNLPNDNAITTVAGSGIATYAGDGILATNASLNGPQNVAFDASGNLYISDSANNRIRRVDINGIITTVAGNGIPAYAGDDGPATSSSINAPSDLALDAHGSLFFADTGNSRIRKIDANGMITTVMGNGVAGYTGDGGPATNASITAPTGVAFDAAGNFYFADSSQQCVRKVDTNGIITTVAGGGNPSGDFTGGPYASNNAALYSPAGIVFDRLGDLYIADTANNRVRKVTPNNLITTVAGIGAGGNYASGDGGAATNASVNYPSGLAFDASGNLYISAGYNNNDIRKIDKKGIITTVAGAGNGSYADGAYSGDGGPAANASLNSPHGLAFDAVGNLYIADWGNDRIREVYFAGDPVLTLTNLTTTNSGNYKVIITDAFGSVTSAVAVLTVVLPPSIVVPPKSQGVLPGSDVTLNAIANGTQPLYYSWYLNSSNLLQTGTNTSLSLTNFSSAEAGQYVVVVTNAYGCATSSVALLELPPAISVDVQPASQTNLVGTTMAFGVTASGIGPFSYQWQFNGTNLSNNIITTVAGGGSGGDGGPATNAMFWGPCTLAFDGSGNMYVSDGGHNMIRKVDPNGMISTVAGNGNEDYSGDGVAATNTSLSSPNGVVVDAMGNLYIGDSANERVRKVGLDGIITTLVGNTATGYFGNFSGDGGVATNATVNYPFGVALDAAGNLYIADSGNHRIRKVDTNGIITTVAGNGNSVYAGDGGTATNASLNYPIGVALDASGNLYIADSGNNRIREVDTNGIIGTVAGNGNSGYAGDGVAATNTSLSSPNGVAVDDLGNLYIADSGNNRIREVYGNGLITTIAGGGSDGDGSAATDASLNDPYGVALDAVGNLYIADTGNNRIREVHFTGEPTLILPAVSTNEAGSYSVVITGPYGSVTSSVATLTVVLPPTIVTQPISQFALASSNVTLSVSATGTAPFSYSWYFDTTNLIQSGASDTLILTNVSPSNSGAFQVIVANAYITATSQVATVTVGFPPSVAISGSQTVLPGTNVAFVATPGGTGPIQYQWQFNGANLPNDIISTVAGNGAAKYAGDLGPAVEASLNSPQGVALDAAGNLYIADAANNRIRKVDSNGVITTVAGGGLGSDGAAATNASLNTPLGVAFGARGSLYMAESQNNRVRKVDTSGVITTVAGGGSGGDGGAATNASLFSPRALTFDATGSLYIADTANNLVRKVDTNGIITTIAGGGSGMDGGAATNASFNYPSGVAFDSIGNLYIADRNNNRVCKVDTNGVITTVAGTGVYGYSGNGSVATSAQLADPIGVTVDAVGNLYIGDSSNCRVRKVDPDGFITTVAGNGSVGYTGDGGAATNTRLAVCSGVISDSSGNIYIADPGNNRIRKVQLYAENPSLILNSVGALNAGTYSVILTSPYGSVTSAVATLTVATPPVITIPPASQIAVAGSSPSFSVSVAGSGPFDYDWYWAGTNLVQSGTNNVLTLPDVSTNSAGNYTVIITNSYGGVTSPIANLTVAILPSATISGNQTVVAGTNVTLSVAAGGTGPLIFHWRLNGTNIIEPMNTVAGTGQYGYAGDGGQATNAYLRGPNAATADVFGNIFIADWGNNCVREVATNGIISTIAGNLSQPAFAIADPMGNIFVSQNGANRISKIGTNGIVSNVVGKGAPVFGGDGGPATNAYVNGPFGIALDASGNLFIADTGNNRIRKVGPDGIIRTIVGRGMKAFAGDGGQATNAALNAPWGVFVDSSGMIFIADTGNNRIREVGTNGIITTIVGNGFSGFSGDGGAATKASLNHPDAVALDGFGNLLIADAGNNRVRQVDPAGVITTLAGGSFASQLLGPSCVAVDASGNILIDDNSNNRIRELAAWWPNLLLPNVSASDAGDYSVIITSPYGSVTSLVATLTVTIPTTPPQIITTDGSFGFTTNQFGFGFSISGAVGQTIAVDGSTNLMDWITLFTNVVDSTSPFYFLDPTATNVPWRFYRARLQ